MHPVCRQYLCWQNQNQDEEPAIVYGDADGEIPQSLQELEQATFLQIVCGEKPLSYFDEFVQEWYSSGGDKLTQEVQKGYDEKNK